MVTHIINIGSFLLAVLLACARQGYVWCPLNVALARSDLTYTLDDLEPALLLVDEEVVGPRLRRGLGICAESLFQGDHEALEEARLCGGLWGSSVDEL